MAFNSYAFFAFLVVIIALYRILPWRYGRIVLVVASYLFYSYAEPWYALLLFTSTLTDYLVGLRVHSAPNDQARKRWLWVSLGVNLGLLGVFKYSAFFIENLNLLLPIIQWEPLNVPQWVLPIGISFYTFQTLAYTIDIYRRNTQPERDFITFALYVAYFPQLVAGPIERAQRLIPQLRKKHAVSGFDFMRGVQRILWGLVKKVVFADRLAVYVDAVYANPTEFGTFPTFLVLFAFMFQLYLDFSGYTDIAIGIARLMGVKLSENFRWPFAARNTTDFWNRWNRTTTLWFTDYVFKPLGGIQRERWLRTLFNTLVVFIATGLWHGADWNFFWFGALSGILVGYYQTMRLFVKKGGPLLGRSVWGKALAIALHTPFGFAVGVFFRTPDVHTGLEVLGGLFRSTTVDFTPYLPFAVLIPSLFAWHVFRSWYVPQLERGKRKDPVHPVWASLFLLLFLILFGFTLPQTFIYFQF